MEVKKKDNAFERARILGAISRADGLLNGTWLAINDVGDGDFDKSGAIQNINEAKNLINKAIDLLQRLKSNEEKERQNSCSHKFPPLKKGEYGFMGQGTCEICGYSDY